MKSVCDSILLNQLTCNFSGSSEIWSDKLKRLYNKAHRATERTEIKQYHGGADGTKSDGGIAYRFLITLLV